MADQLSIHHQAGTELIVEEEAWSAGDCIVYRDGAQFVRHVGLVGKRCSRVREIWLPEPRLVQRELVLDAIKKTAPLGKPVRAVDDPGHDYADHSYLLGRAQGAPELRQEIEVHCARNRCSRSTSRVGSTSPNSVGSVSTAP